MADETPPPVGAPEPNPYTELPPAIRLDQTITSQEAQDPADPEAGRDTDRDFLLRYFA